MESLTQCLEMYSLSAQLQVWLFGIALNMFMFTFHVLFLLKKIETKEKKQVIIGMACKCDDVLNVFGIKPISNM